MALVCTLGPVGSTIDLTDSTKHALAANGFEFVTRQRTQHQLIWLTGLDLSKLQGFGSPQLEVALSIHFAGASQDALIASLREVTEQIRKARQYMFERIGDPVLLTYKTPNATNSVVLDVIGGENIPLINDYDLLTNNLFDVPVRLLCQPWFRPATATTVTSASFNYAYSKFTGIPGDMPALVRMQIKNTGSGTYDYIRVGLRSFGNVDNLIAQYKPGYGGGSDYAVSRPAGSPRSIANASTYISGTFSNLLTNGNMESAFSGGYYPSAPELVTNGDFESGAGVAAGWLDISVTPPAAPATDTTNSPQGTYHLRLDHTNAVNPGSDSSTSYVHQIVPVTQGTAYRFTCVMKVSAAQAIGKGMKVSISGVGDTQPQFNLGGNAGATTKVLVESTNTSYVSHTWDFIASSVSVQIRTWYDGIAGTNGWIDTISIKERQEIAGSWSVNGTISCYKAIDLPASNYDRDVTGTRVKEGSAAQGVGQGDVTGNYLSQNVSVISGVTYRLRAQIKRTSSAAVTSSQGPVGACYVVLIIGSQFITLTGTSPTFAPYEATLTSTSTGTGVVLIFCDTQVGGIVDSILLVQDDAANDELVRFTVTANLSDFYGDFAVYGRCKATTNPVELQVRSGGATGNLSLNESVTVPVSTNYQEILFGHIHIPGQQVPSSVVLGSFSFGIWLVPSAMMDYTAGATYEVWDIELCPINEGFWETVTASGAGPANSESACLDCREIWFGTYLLNSSGNHKSMLPINGGGRVTLPVGTTKAFVHVAPSITNDPGGSLPYTLTLDYFSRFIFLR